MAFRASILITAFLIRHCLTLQVTPNSPCSSFCIDSNDLDFSDPNSSNTENDDITCYDSKYTTSSAGQKFERCISCLQDSTGTTCPRAQHLRSSTTGNNTTTSSSSTTFVALNSLPATGAVNPATVCTQVAPEAAAP